MTDGRCTARPGPGAGETSRPDGPPAPWRLLPDWRGAGLPAELPAGARAPEGVALLQALAREPGADYVHQDDWHWPRRGDWMARLDEAVLGSSGPLRLAGLGLGAHLVAAWAAHSRHAGRISHAWLIEPVDTSAADAPPQWAGWRQAVRQKLPFPARVVACAIDPRDERGAARQALARRLAADWGADWGAERGPR